MNLALYIERFYREVLKPDGREPTTVNLAYNGKAAREMAHATGRPRFPIDSSLNEASKFDLQKQNSEPPVVEIGGELILTSKEAQ